VSGGILLTARERLVRAAIQVFSEKGFSGASTREIARRARVNPVTLFRTFNSKEQLHAAAVDYLIGGLQVREQIDALAERGDPAPKFIAGVIKTLVDANFHAPEVQRIFLNAALERSEVAFTAVWERLLPIFQRVQAPERSGNKKMARFAAHLSGLTAYQVISEAHCPVLTVHATAEKGDVA
jgi:AcrR family transcriptional regulator